jgi:phosphoglycolate phosphatase
MSRTAGPTGSGTPRWPVVLFDLDGTLTDPLVGITRCLAHALEAVGVPVPEPSQLAEHIGPPLVEGFTSLGVPSGRIDDAIAAYRDRFARVGMFENAVIAGVVELLDALVGAGAQLAVATSKPEPFAVQILEHFAIADRFDMIAGATLDNRRRHKDDVIAHALDGLAYPAPRDVVMIGDREHDVFGAQAHGLTSVGVLWGYGSRGELLDAGADHIVDTVAALTVVLLAGPPRHHATASPR